MQMHLHDQVSINIKALPVSPNSATSSPPTSASKGDDPAPTISAIGAWVLDSRSGHCANLVVTHQPTPMSHLVAMVCDGCFINHIPEDYIIDGYILDYGISSSRSLMWRVARLTSSPSWTQKSMKNYRP